MSYTGAPTFETLELTRTVAHKTLYRWLTWVDTAEPVPEDARDALATCNLSLRRSSGKNKATISINQIRGLISCSEQLVKGRQTFATVY
ncbi:MAG: hypothetical protein V7L29_05715 [Nostoc sp.]|uniref:hypothetical protein n=1 Tax=Nostoc sp. TaxID=1180 RepID=UPI002FF976C2